MQERLKAAFPFGRKRPKNVVDDEGRLKHPLDAQEISTLYDFTSIDDAEHIKSGGKGQTMETRSDSSLHDDTFSDEGDFNEESPIGSHQDQDDLEGVVNFTSIPTI